MQILKVWFKCHVRFSLPASPSDRLSVSTSVCILSLSCTSGVLADTLLLMDVVGEKRLSAPHISGVLSEHENSYHCSECEWTDSNQSDSDSDRRWRDSTEDMPKPQPGGCLQKLYMLSSEQKLWPHPDSVNLFRYKLFFFNGLNKNLDNVFLHHLCP